MSDAARQRMMCAALVLAALLPIATLLTASAIDRKWKAEACRDRGWSYVDGLGWSICMPSDWVLTDEA